MTGPAPAVAAARSAVTAVLADLPEGALVLVACSGGPDSLALAAATAFVAARAGWRAVRAGQVPVRAGAVVVDHGLQRDSARVAADAATACRALGLDPVEVVRVRPGSAGGPEAAARDARLAALDDAAHRWGAAAVLLGHTLDDQAEQVLLGLARGAGARSLAGMPARRGLLVRPFLGLRRAETLAVCAALGLTPWHDPTNGPGPGAMSVRAAADCGVPTSARIATGAPPLRSRVRADVLPVLERVLGPGVARALVRTADQLREDADALDALAGELLVAATRERTRAEPAATVRLDVAVLAAALPAVRRRALRSAATHAGSPAGAVHRVHVVALDALVTDWHGQGQVDLRGLRVTRTCGTLVFQPDR